MPNIMVTYRCNLRCPYCFANEFVNLSSADMALEAFDKALAFLTKSGPTCLGLIGGEPTLHPQFNIMLERIINNPYITEATVYTNGILLDKYMKLLVHPKFRMLVNWNSPAQIGEQTFKRIQDNVDALMFEYHMKDRINLGLNLHDKDMDYSYMMELLKRYNLHRLRVSLTVPNFEEGLRVDVMEYFHNNKSFLLRFFKDMDSIQVLPYYDCNKPPYCIWTDEEREWLESYVKKYPVSESTLIGHKSFCYPVVDILPTLQAVRCFGMSDFDKVNIDDFDNAADIASYFLNTVDSCAYKISAHESCKSCYQRLTRHCTAGCIGFKAKEISDTNVFVSNL